MQFAVLIYENKNSTVEPACQEERRKSHLLTEHPAGIYLIIIYTPRGHFLALSTPDGNKEIKMQGIFSVNMDRIRGEKALFRRKSALKQARPDEIRRVYCNIYTKPGC